MAMLNNQRVILKSPKIQSQLSTNLHTNLHVDPMNLHIIS
jgi:hypothetical protein